MNCGAEIANLWMNANGVTIDGAKSSPLILTPGSKTATQKPEILSVGHLIVVNSTIK